MKNQSNISKWSSRIIKGMGIVMGATAAVKVVRKTIRPPEKLKIKNKVILITGGGRGLGLVLARKLAAFGPTVVICGRSAETLQKAAADLSTRTEKYLAIPCDIRDKQQVQKMVQQIEEETGGVDILINNAGVIQTGPVETMNQEDFEQAMDTHFWGPFYLIREVLPGMKKKKKGNIVNIASIGSKVSFPHLLPYNTSKYALAGFSEGLSAELRKFNIRVTTIYPGLMRTGSPRNIQVKGQHKKEYAWFKVSDSLPFISMNAERAADKIIDALREEKRTRTLTIPAKLAVALHGIAPAFTIAALDFVNVVLPEGKKNGIKKGYQSESKVSSSFLTEKTEEAARQNLEK